MKKHLSKSLMLLICLFAIGAAFGVSAQAKTIVSGDFTYETTSSGVTLTEYKGSAASVEIPSKVKDYKVTVIGAEAFWANKKMTSVTIPSTVTKIEYAAFNECTSLSEVVIPSSVKTIGEAAFWYCTGLKSIVIPASVTKIEKDAFKGCTSLTAYTEKGSKAEEYIKTLDFVKQGYRYAETIKLSSSSLTMALNSSKTLTATLTPSPLYSSKVTFKSSDKKVATVSSKGVIKAVGLGQATITVTTADGSKLSKKCTVKVIPQTVKNLKQTAITNSSVTLSWSKISGVTGYKVYKLNAKDKWELASTTSKLTYTDSKLSMGDTAQYKVRAYTKMGSKTYYGAYSSVLKVTMSKPGVVGKLTATKGENYITLTWTKAENANGYKVYLYDSKTGKFTEKASVTALTYKVTGLTANTEYKLAVKAYYKASASNITYADKQKEITASTKPSVVNGLTYDKNAVYFDRVTLNWKQSKNISGYQISINNTATKETKTETVGVDKTSYTVSSLDPNTKYTFKIRAYTKRESGTVYSSYSSGVSVTTLSLPATKKAAFDGFMEALNSTKVYEGTAVLFKEVSTKDFSGDRNDTVLSNMVSTGQSTTVFKEGKSPDGNIVSAYVGPVNAESTLRFEDINSDNFTYEADGSGYTVIFTLDSEDKSASKNSLITSPVNWDKVKEAAGGFILVSCNYTGTRITAKVQGGLISYMEIEMPVTVHFKTGLATTYSFTQTIVTTTAFAVV